MEAGLPQTMSLYHSDPNLVRKMMQSVMVPADRFDADDPANPYRLSASPKRNIAKKMAVEVRVLWNALSWRFIPSICGPYHTIIRQPAHMYSEWGAIRLWARRRQLLKLAEMGTVSLGSILIPPIVVPLLLGTGHRSSTFIEGHAESPDKDNELWLYINGVSVTRSLQRMNGKQLVDVFGRDVLLSQSHARCSALDRFGPVLVSTCCRTEYEESLGMAFDLFECMMGRTFNKVGKVARKLSDFLHDTFVANPNKKVILIAHSQGTIITSNAIEYLIRENKCEGLQRLEVYTFGCAATEFFQVRDRLTGDLVPYYEHYANGSDFVAKIGALRDRGQYPYPFPGPIFVRQKEGHLLGEHYLPGLVQREFVPMTSEAAQPSDSTPISPNVSGTTHLSIHTQEHLAFQK